MVNLFYFQFFYFRITIDLSNIKQRVIGCRKLEGMYRPKLVGIGEYIGKDWGMMVIMGEFLNYNKWAVIDLLHYYTTNAQGAASLHLIRNAFII